jgi:hypothetical protein
VLVRGDDPRNPRSPGTPCFHRIPLALRAPAHGFV